jgi:energy-coupling factor transporter transmembrane protein EcfT
MVSEITSETATATESVTANSRNRRPTRPPMNNSGMKTATSEILIESTVKPTSREPLSAASSGVRPSSRCLAMFSSTTMASSTTKPVEIVSAISDRLSRL